MLHLGQSSVKALVDDEVNEKSQLGHDAISELLIKPESNSPIF